MLSKEDLENWNNYAIDRLRRYEEEEKDPLIQVRDILRQSTAGQYIWELLQNAEDAHATKVSVNLSKESLIFQHNGSLKFSLQDAIAITKVGISNKTELPSIGQFGVGFKSVFKYAERVEIYASNLRFALENYTKIINNIPLASGVENDDEITAFKIIFKENLQASALKDSLEVLGSFNHESLLFLQYLNEIDIRTDVFINKIQKKDLGNSQLSITATKDELSDTSFWHIRTQAVTTELKDGNSNIKSMRETYLGYAIKLAEAGGKFSQVDKGKIFTYFPLEEQISNLKFHIHAPFVINLNRSMLDTNENNMNENNRLIKLVSILISSDILKLHASNGLDTSLLTVLPISSDALPGYLAPINKDIFQIFQNNRMVKVSSGVFTNPEEIFQAAPEVIDLLGDEGLRLFNEVTNSKLQRVDPGKSSKGKYLLPQPSEARMTSFLRYVGVIVIDNTKIKEFFEELIFIFGDDNRRANSTKLQIGLNNWLESKSDLAIQKFYLFLGKLEIPRFRLKNLPIFRTSQELTDKYQRIEDVYLPTSLEQNEIDVVKSSVYFRGNVQRDKLHELQIFFENLGIKEKDEWIVLEHEVTKNAYPDSRDKEKVRIPYFLSFYNKDKNRFLDIVRDRVRLIGEEFNSDSKIWAHPEKIFQTTSDFNVHKLNSLADESERELILWSGYTLNSEFENMVRDLGVNTNLRINREIGSVSFLQTILHSQDLSLLIIFWRFVQTLDYSDFIMKIGRDEGESKLLRKLNEISWIPMSDGSFKTPYECDPAKLAKEFQDYSGIFFSISDFGMKTQEQVLSSDHANLIAKEAGFDDALQMALMAKLAKQYTPEELARLDKTKQISIASNSVLEKKAVESVDLEFNQEDSQQEYDQLQSNQRREKTISNHSEEPIQLESSELSNHSVNSLGTEPDRSASRSISSGSGGTEVRQAYIYVKQEPTEKGQSIQAEKMAGESLSREFVIKHEIEEGRIPKEMSEDNAGYDIKSTEKNGDIRFIEVKSISGQWGGEGITVSPSQINFAQEYKKAFWLYVVENIGKSNARLHKLQDPMKYVKGFKFNEAWKEIASSIDLENTANNLREGSIGEEDIGSRIFHTDKGECWLVGWMQNGETVKVILQFDNLEHDETLPLNTTKMRKLNNK